jgi:hypothetical protein
MPNWMYSRIASMAICALASLTASASAIDFSPAATHMFRELRRQPNDLARYMYLRQTTPELPVGDQPWGLQMFASVEDELGHYDEALRDFPLKSHLEPDAHYPERTGWVSEDATDAIIKLAANRRLVMVNEAHHDAHTRELTLALLPRLHALGFNYFAAEALSGKDVRLMQRGYPVTTSGTEYLHEPTYGDIIRTAIRLGFTVVAYDADSNSANGRESGQAKNLYEQTFAKDPRAKLFVHAGYAHIDKAKGRLGNVEPMAMHLQQLSGIEPLSIDQTQFREQIPSSHGAYRRLISDFPSEGPIVLINRATGKPWSANPSEYDANVLLPPGAAGFVESGLVPPTSNVRASDRDHLSLPEPVTGPRPKWLLRLNGRTPWPIDATMCRTTFPCMVEAIHIEESDDAIAADRYAFMRGDVVSRLYLPTGRYRLRAWDIAGKTLSEQVISVGKH